ncbi:MAG: PIG-L family deacetylase [Fimbriimonas sp.]|nr:PIG-L family deacetylase [Fimbriimonas sp.]
MKVFSTDPDLRWLFCLTHPDDEISICVWISRLVRAGNPVFLSWTHSNPVREREAREAARILGVPDQNLTFFHATDGSVCDEIAELLPKFKGLIETVRPDRVCCGAFEQGHLDHDSTNYLVNRTFDGPVLEIPFYHTYTTRLQRMNRFSDSRGEEILPLDLEDQRLKKRIARQYPSQNIWHVLLLYEAWQTVQFQRIALAKSERMRFQTHRLFAEPNHPPLIAQKVKSSPSWGRWLQSLNRAESDALNALPANSSR